MLRGLLLAAVASQSLALTTFYGACPSNPASPCVLFANASVETVAVDANNACVITGAGIDYVSSLPATSTTMLLRISCLINLASNNITGFGKQTSSVSSVWPQHSNGDSSVTLLSDNLLPSLNELPSLPALRTLDLSFNEVRRLDSNTDFQGLSQLYKYRESFHTHSQVRNQISVISNPTFPPALKYLDLSGNPISVFDVTYETYNVLANMPDLVLDKFMLSSCSGQLVMLRTAIVCVTNIPNTAALRSTTSPIHPYLKLSRMYGPIFVIFSSVMVLMLVYFIGRRIFLGPQTPTDRTLRATCLSSNYSRMEDDPVEYRISLSMELDTSELTAALKTDPELRAFRLPLHEVKKLKLVAASTVYTTYVAQHLSGKADAKVLTPCASAETTLARLGGLVAEVQLLARLAHPKIVALVGYAASPSLLDLTVVTEFMSFGSLAAVLREPALAATLQWTADSVRMVPKLQVVADVAAALAYLHGLPRPVLHNAVSTETVLVSSKWEAKLGNFTHASYADDTSAVLPSPVPVEAPEVARGESRSPASDIYQLGRLMQELDSASESSTMPAAVQAIVAQCLDNSAVHRPSAEEVLFVLNSCL
ncbi:protein kinase [Achlya hypogyna]|uniref:Protein kinase n=1 Tax=Achlya hypogyna TaxID=1202772 RepID=A0A1V9YMT3_ACHHY|nr:protein kinase [Achlya hypogyna]